jgi:hypothetical protein
LSITCQAFRLPGYFFWNALMPIFLISFAALGPFVIDFKSATNRLPATATMLLSSISFKSGLSRLLPTVSYLTSMDYYSLSSIAIIATMFIYHSLFAALNHFLINENVSYLIDKFAFVVFLGSVVCMQVVYAAWLKKIYSYRLKLIQESKFHSNDENILSDEKKNN